MCSRSRQYKRLSCIKKWQIIFVKHWKLIVKFIRKLTVEQWKLTAFITIRLNDQYSNSKYRPE